jgi:hypothetical protein
MLSSSRASGNVADDEIAGNREGKVLSLGHGQHPPAFLD